MTTPPPSFLCRVLPGKPMSVDLLVATVCLSPNTFYGTPPQVQALLVDFNCLDGAPWIRNHYEPPWKLIDYQVKPSTLEQATNLLDEMPIPDLSKQVLLNGTAGRCPIAPENLPSYVSGRPAYEWAIKIIDLLLSPIPDKQLIDFRTKGWWYSWA